VPDASPGFGEPAGLTPSTIDTSMSARLAGSDTEPPVSEEVSGEDDSAGSDLGAPGKAGEPRHDGKHEQAKEKERGFLSFMRELPVLILLAFGLALIIKTLLVQAFFIPSASMEPTLLPGDRVLVNKVVYHVGDIHRGDVIVFENPNPEQVPDRGVVGGFLHWLSEGLGFARPENEDFIKRVVGLPGETVEIRHHQVIIDGKPLEEPYLTRPAVNSMLDYGPVTVPNDALFVMGDNRGNSNDSRALLGFIPLDRVIGRAFVIIWPPGRMGLIHGT
jgi:signal peptidase I